MSPKKTQNILIFKKKNMVGRLPLITLVSLCYLFTTIFAVTGTVYFGQWKIHSIRHETRESKPPLSSSSATLLLRVALHSLDSLHSSTDRTGDRTGGDADLFVAPCGLYPDDVVSEYLGYSFTHGVDVVELPMYTIKDMQDGLCAYVLGRGEAVVKTSYVLHASLIREGAEDSAEIGIQHLPVSIGTLGLSQFGNEEFNQQDQDHDRSSNESDGIEEEEESTVTFVFRTAGKFFFILLEFIFS